MIIIAGHLIVEADERDGYVSALRDLVTRARESDGCLHVAITADSVDERRVNNVEVWRDAAALELWRSRANAPALPEPITMDVRRYDATDGGPLF